MDESSRFARNRLDEASRARRSANLLATVLGTAAVALVIVLFVAFLDYWLMLVPAVRFGGLAVVVLLLAGGIYKLVQVVKRPSKLKDAALDAEAAKPEIGCELSTAAEYLSGERKPSQQYENELAGALQDKAAAHLQKIQIPYWQRVIRPALIVGILLLIALFFTVLASGGFTAFQRAVFPWSNASYTSVEVLPGNVEIPMGRDLEIKSIFSGRLPSQAKFEWQDDSSATWQLAALTGNEKGEFIHPLKAVRTPLKYRVSGSDAISPEYRVEPYLPAEVSDVMIDLQLPAYTGRRAFSQGGYPDITVLRGSVATIQIAANVKLSKAQLYFKDGAPIDLAPTENGFWKGEITISKDAEYRVELADEKGRPGNATGFYEIKALPDDVPVVEIAEPGEDIRAASTNVVPVKIKAMDDYGLQEIKLVFHRLGGPEEFIVAKRNGETNTEYTAEIPLSPLGLKEYELVAYHALATDNNILDGPGIGKSDVYFIEITDKEGGECKCQGKGDRVNLLVIQKQIIADTIALGPNPDASKIEDLAKRQADAVEFGRMYHEAISASGAAPAIQEMTTAIQEMESAQRALGQQHAKVARPHEERALASLYQVVNLMPELEDLPTVPPEQKPEEQEEKPPTLQVVLQEIKKKKEEQPETEQLAKAVEEAKRLQDEQASINLGVQNSGGNPQSGAPSETQIDRSGKSEQSAKKQGEKSDPTLAAKSQKNSKGSKGKSKSGQKGQGGGGSESEEQQESDEENPESEQLADANKAGKGGKSGKNGKGKGEGEPKDEQELAQKETELSKEAAELAEKLARLAGKDKRLGHGAKRMNEAAETMQAAAEAIGRGDTVNAGTQGAQAGAALEATVAMLERILQGRPERVDVSNEEAPKQFETAIADYFKALSYE